VAKIKVGIVAGGQSSEHEVSCISAAGVLASIDRTKFEPILIGITKSGQWVLPPADIDLSVKNGALPTISEEHPHTSIEAIEVDLLFPVLHGTYGEDGIFQGQCEQAGVRYVGSGVRASADGMDKSISKRIFAEHGLAVADGVVIHPQTRLSDIELAKKLTLPVFVKPASGGSSRGTSKVKSWDDLETAVAEAFEFDEKVLVETGIIGKEVECAVLDRDGVVQASPVGEIQVVGGHEFYDFEAKYLDNSTKLIIPAEIPAVAAAKIQQSAIAAFTALGCAGLARVDFFYCENGEIIINEINTMPGFTATSAFPKMWAVGGINYTELITTLIETALAR
jgi:D-alanine-D-alanine ligase